jgi:hypothetical protein
MEGRALQGRQDCENFKRENVFTRELSWIYLFPDLVESIIYERRNSGIGRTMPCQSNTTVFRLP